MVKICESHEASWAGRCVDSQSYGAYRAALKEQGVAVRRRLQDDTDTSGDEVALEMDAPRMQLFNGDQAAVDNANGKTEDTETTADEGSGSTGVVVAGLVVVVLVVVGALYATGMIGAAAGTSVAGGMGAGNAGQMGMQ